MVSEPRVASPARDCPKGLGDLLLWFIPLATLVACIIVALRRLPLWIPGQCTWSYQDDPNLAMALVPLGLLVVLALFQASWLRSAESHSRLREAVHVFVVCALAFAISLSFRLTENFGFARLAILTVNPASGGFFQAAYDSRESDDWLARFPETMEKDRHHVATHPPGNVGLMRWWLAQSHHIPALVTIADEAVSINPGVRLAAVSAFCKTAWKHSYDAADTAAAWWGGITLLGLASLIPALVYAQARLLFGTRAAVHASVLAAVVPSFVIFVPACDLSYAFCSELTLMLVTIAMVRRSNVAALLAGLAAACGFMFTFTFAAIGALAVSFIILSTKPDARRKGAVTTGFFLAGGLLGVVLLQWLGVPWLVIYRTTKELVPKLVIGTGRVYTTWLFFDLADFFTFLGVPMTLLTFAAIARTKREWSDLRPLLVAALGVILLVDLSGYILAETARIWMLFIPPLLVVAGTVVARMAERDARIPSMVFASQAAQALVFAVFFNVWTLT